MSKRKVGVYICHCGGNISDYVDVEKVRSDIEKDYDVVVTRTTMFTCSDASQNQIMEDIREMDLDGIVVASCSPKLHLSTFRSAADRAGLNQFQYIQVNIREQCSWAHSDDPKGATKKAVGLVRGGLEKAKLTEPLEPIRVTSVKSVLIIGAGIAGLRAAIEAADLGVEVSLVEREKEAGGTVGNLGTMYPSGRKGSEITGHLMEQVRERKNITLYTGSKILSREGHIGNFDVRIRVATGDEIALNIGAIIVATGFRPYAPAEGEYGMGLDGVVTLP
jgi:heterodisulfide reductase subunit A